MVTIAEWLKQQWLFSVGALVLAYLSYRNAAKARTVAEEARDIAHTKNEKDFGLELQPKASENPQGVFEIQVTNISSKSNAREVKLFVRLDFSADTFAFERKDTLDVGILKAGEVKKFSPTQINTALIELMPKLSEAEKKMFPNGYGRMMLDVDAEYQAEFVGSATQRRPVGYSVTVSHDAISGTKIVDMKTRLR